MNFNTQLCYEDPTFFEPETLCGPDAAPGKTEGSVEECQKQEHYF
jgi:hypothetical protein